MGYALRKAKRKFPSNGNDIAKLCREEATFEFGQNVERIKDRLHFPVRDLYDVFRQIYCIYLSETKNAPKDINFNIFLKRIKASHFYENFEDKLKHDYNMENFADDVLNYTTELFVKVLSHRFAKFVLNQLQKKTSKCTGSLRASLNQSSKLTNQ